LKSTGEVVAQRVRTQTTPCHLGGERHWFTCPRCNKRVAVLYAPGRHFACRQCGGLRYATQKEKVGDRASTKANKLRTRRGYPLPLPLPSSLAFSPFPSFIHRVSL
jgi:PHP family Zn ribbon phosphoesterase